MDMFGNNIFKDNPAAQDNLAKPIKCTSSSVRFLSKVEFLDEIDGNLHENSKIQGDTIDKRDSDISDVNPSGSVESLYDTTAKNAFVPTVACDSAQSKDTANSEEQEESNKWISECLDTIETMKSIKSASTRELQVCLQELENIVVNSQRNFTAALIRTKRGIMAIIPSLKKSDPDREMKQMQIDKYQKTVSMAVKAANEVASNQVQYLRFLHKLTTYLLSKADQELFLGCEIILLEMNQTIGSLASETVTRSIIELQCVMEEFSTYFGHNVPHSVLAAACIMQEDCDRFLYDVNDSSSDLMRLARNGFINHEAVREKNTETLNQTIRQLKNKYKELGKKGMFPDENRYEADYANRAFDELDRMDLDLNTVVSTNPDGDKSEKSCVTENPKDKDEESETFFTNAHPNDLTRKTSLQSLLRQWTSDFIKLFTNLNQGHDMVLHNIYVFSSSTGSKYQSFLRQYRGEFIQDFKYEYKEVLNHLLWHVKEMSSNKPLVFPTLLDIMDMDHQDYPAWKERVIDTYISRIKAIHSETISFIANFSNKFGRTLDKCLKLHYKLLKHNTNSLENINQFRYQNALLLITLLSSFHRHIQKLIAGITSLFLDVSGRLNLHLTSEFRTLVGNFELESIIQANAFTLALHGIVEKCDAFVKRCWDAGNKMGQRDTLHLKTDLKKVNEALQDFVVTQPILMCKKEGEKVFENNSNGGIDGFLARRFSKIHATSTPISVLKIPGLLRSILKRNDESVGSLNDKGDLNNNTKASEEPEEASVMWIGEKKSKCKVRFEDDGEEKSDSPKMSLKGARSLHKWNCGEEVHGDLDNKQIAQEY